MTRVSSGSLALPASSLDPSQPKRPITPQDSDTGSTGPKGFSSKREKLDVLQQECNALISELDSSQEDAELIVKKHIKQLKRYNELKDVALSLVSLIADQKHLPVQEILDEMKVEPGDD
ncbi:unnamed protein product [Kuraishia capsulata CBS 1993]|uniref:Swi5-domain-containing protein n=1 Tax=Kuraishia capsulata CBS 1993 TaxID=1382522 RepID=W6MXQ9_9ASCO|nr:uncharacterized protein KUCA_T00005308001 [Kuraishia capsulata CBS 1993]CDK29320.1 unnamed protein product [Kuraishia capsulata CBS 1993]